MNRHPQLNEFLSEQIQQARCPSCNAPLDGVSAHQQDCPIPALQAQAMQDYRAGAFIKIPIQKEPPVPLTGWPAWRWLFKRQFDAWMEKLTAGC